MCCDGIVVDVNPAFLFFKLDNDIRVHMSILLTQEPLQKLPKIGSKVTIKNAHRLLTSYVVCKLSTLKGEFTIDYDKNRFFSLICNYKFGFNDLFKVDEIIDTFDKNYDLNEDLKVYLIQSTLEHIVKMSNYTVYKEDVCLNKCISSSKLITVSSCKSVEIQTDEFVSFPYWSFGIQSKIKDNAVLFGYLTIQPNYGFLVLKDCYYQIPCVICNAVSEKIRLIEDTYALIEKYKIITEVFQESSVANLEYLLIDVDDIKFIYAEEVSSSCLFGEAVMDERHFRHTLYFELLRKSMVTTGGSKKPECWFLILVNNDDRIKSGEVFLILPLNYIKTVIYFDEGQHYQLFYNEILNETQNIELSRVKMLKIYRLLEDFVFFRKDDGVLNSKPQLLTVKECKQYILHKTDLVSFQGVLKHKRFTNAVSSRTKKYTSLYGFGTPGSKVHQLVFCSNLNDKEETYLDCYLNNWENTLMPLGLIPQMRVIVRNVYPQSRKYLKASPLTSFEIVAYEPIIHFETVNLYGNSKLDWGHRFFLGHGNKLPYGVLIWGRVYNIQIHKVQMKSTCGHCSFVNEVSGPCIRCKETERKMNFLVKMQVCDEFGQSKVLTKDPEIMKVLLDLQDYQFQIWLKAFKELSQYTYNFFEETDFTDYMADRYLFKHSLTEYLKSFNEQGMLVLDLKCRHMYTDIQRSRGRAFWFCIDARKSIY